MVARSDNGHLRGVAYEKFPFWKPLANGVCIFTDPLRNASGPASFHWPCSLRPPCARFTGNYTVLNDPGRYIGRFNFLKILHRQGINDFRVHRIGELGDDLKFPVFLRNELDHDGPATPLLHSRDELNRVLAQKKFRRPALRKHLMLVEYCDCAERQRRFPEIFRDERCRHSR